MTYRGWEGVTEADLQKVGRPTKPPARSKYGAKKTAVDGLTFDSKREAARYVVLGLRLKAGDIRRLKCQPRYYLCPLVIDQADVRDINAGWNSARRIPVAEYIADFEYEESDRGHGGVTWKLIVEDVKGAKTDVYKLKKRWFEAQYGLVIRET